jgi:diphthamide synthase subunit DPH2
LQFPDGLKPYSVAIAEELEKRIRELEDKIDDLQR